MRVLFCTLMTLHFSCGSPARDLLKVTMKTICETSCFHSLHLFREGWVSMQWSFCASFQQHSGTLSVSSSLSPLYLNQFLLSDWGSGFCVWPTESRRWSGAGGSYSVASINDQFALVFCPVCQSALLFASHRGWWRKVAEGQQNWIYFFGKPWVIKLINLHVMNGGWIIVCRIYLPVW